MTNLPFGHLLQNYINLKPLAWKLENPKILFICHIYGQFTYVLKIHFVYIISWISLHQRVGDRSFFNLFDDLITSTKSFLPNLFHEEVFKAIGLIENMEEKELA